MMIIAVEAGMDMLCKTSDGVKPFCCFVWVGSIV